MCIHSCKQVPRQSIVGILCQQRCRRRWMCEGGEQVVLMTADLPGRPGGSGMAVCLPAHFTPGPGDKTYPGPRAKALGKHGPHYLAWLSFLPPNPWPRAMPSRTVRSSTRAQVVQPDSACCVKHTNTATDALRVKDEYQTASRMPSTQANSKHWFTTSLLQPPESLVAGRDSGKEQAGSRQAWMTCSVRQPG